MLLVLMLAVAVLTITMLGVARNYRRSIQRDREVEMIHRGAQYARAVRRFYIKNGRYPVSLEQLENFNKVRYLRKRYKDPMSPDGEWKIVHPTDVKLKNSVVQTAAGSTPGATQTSGSPGVTNTASQATDGTNTGSTGTTGDTGTASGTSTDSGSSGSAFGSSGNSSGNAGSTQGASMFGSGTGTNNAANGQVLGGGDIYGVVSKSKKEGFHIFGEKSKYNEWFFIYDPGQDQNNGRLITGPYNPKMFVGTANSGLDSSKGTTGTGGTGTAGSSGSTSTPGTTSPGLTTPASPTQ